MSGFRLLAACSQRTHYAKDEEKRAETQSTFRLTRIERWWECYRLLFWRLTARMDADPGGGCRARG
jgi:hypothetical protein